MLKSTLRAGRLVAYWLLDRLVLVRPAKKLDTALVVRLDGIGDFVVWLQSGAGDIVADLRKHHAQVVLVANQAWASLAADLKVFDEVIAVQPVRFMRDPLYRLRVLWRVRGLHARTTIQPRSARVFLQEDEIVRASGSEQRIGAAASTVNMSDRLVRYASGYYSRIIPIDHTSSRHESAKNIDFARGLCGYTGAIIAPACLNSNEAGLSSSSSYVVIAPGAGWSGRQWPPSKFGELASRLATRANIRFIIVGSKFDAGLAKQIQECATDAVFEDMTGKLTLTDTVNLISNARFVVSNESGPMHIAVWCGTPVAGLVGGGHFGWFAPYPASFPNAQAFRLANKPMPCYGCNWSCVFDVRQGQAVPCIAEIEVDHVFRATVALLA